MMFHTVRGFTYLEMVFAVAILAILAAVTTPLMQKQMRRHQEYELRQNLRELRAAIDAYKAAYDEGRMIQQMGRTGYPRSLQELVEGVEDAKDPKKAKLYFMRRIPIDPMFVASEGEAVVDAAETWRKRCYQCEPDQPWNGQDVYDVHSANTGVGLNGVPYAQW